jgi:hypothetical protein
MNPPSLVGTKIFYLQFHSLTQINDLKVAMVYNDSSWANRHVETKLVSQCFKAYLFLSSRWDEMSDKAKVTFILHVCTWSLLF